MRFRVDLAASEEEVETAGTSFPSVGYEEVAVAIGKVRTAFSSWRGNYYMICRSSRGSLRREARGTESSAMINVDFLTSIIVVIL